MIEVGIGSVFVAAVACIAFQLGVEREQKRATHELTKARLGSAKYRMLLKMRPRHVCDVCGNGQSGSVY